MDRDCPSPGTYLESGNDTAGRDRFLAHAVECPSCFDLIDMAADGLETAAVPRTGPRARKPLAAAAAGILAVAAAGWYLREGGAGSPPQLPAFVLPAGERIVEDPGEYAAPPDADRFLALPDGTRLRLERGAALRVEPSRKGERTRLRLLFGALEAEIVPGDGPFRILAGAGEIDVLGTHLRASAFTLGPDAPCLCVEVYSGRILVTDSAQVHRLPVSGGERGIVAWANPPEKQELGGTWETPLRSFLLQLEAGPAGFRIRPDRTGEACRLAALLFGSRWAESPDLEEAPGDPEPVRAAKRILREMKR